MSNIIDFPKEEEPKLIWFCGHCNCSSFFLYNDYTVECAGCGHNSDGGEWVRYLAPSPKAPTEKDNSTAINTIAWGSPEFSRKSVMKHVKDWDANIAMLAVWNHDGAMKSWTDIATQEQKDWCIRHMQDLLDQIKSCNVDS